MQFSWLKREFRIFVFLCIVQSSIFIISCYEFDQNYFGVFFQPYVKHDENGRRLPSIRSYTRKNVETTMNVVSGKYSKILVYDHFSAYGRYIRNFTYESESYPSVYAGEVAAQINRKNDSKLITLIYNVIIASSYKHTEASVLLTLEASEKANNMAGGTVKGVSIGWPKNLSEMLQLLHLLQFHAPKASQLGLKLGAALDCYWLIKPVNGTTADIQQQIIQKSDFIICISGTEKETPAAAWKAISKSLLSFRRYILSIKRNTEVIAAVEWSNGSQKPGAAENTKVFWQSANYWAVSNKYRIFLNEALVMKNTSGLVVTEPGKRNLSANSTTVKPKIPARKNGRENANESKAGLSTWNATIIPWTVTIALIAALAIVLYLYFKQYQTKQTLLSSSDIKEFINGSSKKYRNGSVTVIDTAKDAPYDASLEIPKDKLRIDENKILGSGEYGIVFQAVIEWEGGCVDQVALEVSKDNCRSNIVKGFLSEIKIMSYLGRHPNIVALKGAYTAELTQGVVYVATELCGLGSLEQYLRTKGRSDKGNDVPGGCAGTEQEIELTAVPNISMLDMFRWSHEIACGMKFLEGKHVVHADLAARNILLTGEKVAKITDFGLSRRMYNYQNYVKTQQEPLPWRWMSIEVLKKLDFSSKSDVWSYGITLWEIFSQGDIPYPGVSWTQSFVTKLMDGLKPDCPLFATQEMYEIMRDCWSFETNERPNFSQLVDVTRNALETSRSMASNSNLYTPIRSLTVESGPSKAIIHVKG